MPIIIIQVYAGIHIETPSTSVIVGMQPDMVPVGGYVGTSVGNP